ncbi:MAG: SEC-C domain-containing protein [Terriglobia bacterium]
MLDNHRVMEFREKVETIIEPMIVKLKAKLAPIPTLAGLNHYQLLIHTVQTDKSKVPDGFFFKWRYFWALLLSKPFSGARVDDRSETEFQSIDKLIEEIFDVYGFGAIYEPGRTRGSEEEFLTRLGLGLKIREPDVLGFLEQIQRWAFRRFQPFNDTYFVPNFGLRFEDIMGWFEDLIWKCQARLDAMVDDLASIYADMERTRAEFVKGQIDIEAARQKSAALEIGERIEANAQQGARMHLFSKEELQGGIPDTAFSALTNQFGIRPGEVDPGYVFPHQDNPLEYRTFVALPDETFYFLDPANAYRIAAKTFERDIVANELLHDRYLRNRDRETERWVTANMRKVFPSAAIYPNYFLEKGSQERDLLVQEGKTVILIECKNTRIRPFKGTGVDLLNFQRDFKHSVQFGYGQALGVKRRILESDETTFFDEKGNSYFSVNRGDIEKIYIICVTITPRGPFGTDLSYELEKSESEPFPLAVGLFDLDTICKHINNPEQFIGYLKERENLHGRVRTGDELNYAGYYLKFGNLEFEDHAFITDDFSGIFDRKWYKAKGIEVEEPKDPPVVTSMIRKGNSITIEHSSGEKEVLKAPSWMAGSGTGKSSIKMKGSERNKPCPCGSGRKLKNCCGIS